MSVKIKKNKIKVTEQSSNSYFLLFGSPKEIKTLQKEQT